MEILVHFPKLYVAPARFKHLTIAVRYDILECVVVPVAQRQSA
jgi:hypothetical protein